MAKRRFERPRKDQVLDLSDKGENMSINLYYKESGPLLTATDLDSEILILPRTLRSGYGDLRFVAQKGATEDPEISVDEREKARGFFREMGVDIPK